MPADVVWGEDSGVTWENATDEQREAFTLVRLFWFYRMVASGGPDDSELDGLVAVDANEAALWFGPILEARARAAGWVE